MTVAADPRPITDRPVPPPHERRPWLGWLSLAARLVLAAVLGWAALSKIADPPAMVRAVRAYELLPEALVVPVAHALPAVELVLALLLLTGVAIRLTGALTAALLTAFLVGIAAAAARGLEIDCGCFGGGGPTDDPQYALEIARDSVLLGLALVVALVPRSRLALDPRRPAPPQPGGGGRRDERRREQAARVERERFAGRMRRHRTVAVALLALTAVVAVLVTPSPAARSEVQAPADVTSTGGILVGDPAAPRRLVVFEDPQCPACAVFERTSAGVIERAVEAGEVAVEYRLRSFLGPESVRAVGALAAAADAGRFAELHAALWHAQPEEHSGGYGVDDLLALGRSVGLEGGTYEQAVRTSAYAPWARLVDDQASRDGNVSTPELRLDGRTLPGDVVFDAERLAAALAGG